MNLIEFKLVDILSDLKNNYYISGVKAEFEAEGSSLEEVIILEDIAKSSGLDLTVKIGGCQAIRDLADIKSLGVSSIVAPMIESSYALNKFVKSVQSVYPDDLKFFPNLYINVETSIGYGQLDDILKQNCTKYLKGIIFGRTDMTGSLGISKNAVDSDIILNYAKTVSNKANEYNLDFCVGGNISKLSIPFLKQIKFLDKFETRKIIFDADMALNLTTINEGIRKAIEFECLWLKYKKEYLNNSYTNIDEIRLKELTERYENSI